MNDNFLPRVISFVIDGSQTFDPTMTFVNLELVANNLELLKNINIGVSFKP